MRVSRWKAAAKSARVVRLTRSGWRDGTAFGFPAGDGLLVPEELKAVSAGLAEVPEGGVEEEGAKEVLELFAHGVCHYNKASGLCGRRLSRDWTPSTLEST